MNRVIKCSQSPSIHPPPRFNLPATVVRHHHCRCRQPVVPPPRPPTGRPKPPYGFPMPPPYPCARRLPWGSAKPSAPSHAHAFKQSPPRRPRRHYPKDGNPSGVPFWPSASCPVRHCYLRPALFLLCCDNKKKIEAKRFGGTASVRGNIS